MTESADTKTGVTLGGWRLWRRRLFRVLLVILITGTVLHVFRTSIAALATKLVLPRIVYDMTGVFAEIQEVKVEEVTLGDGRAGLSLTIKSIRGTGSGRQVAIEDIAVFLRGWKSLIEPVTAVEHVTVRSLVASSTSEEPTRHRDGELIALPDLPRDIPRIPFPIQVKEIDIRSGEFHVVGSLQVESETGSLECTTIDGIPTVESGTATWVEREGVREFSVLVHPGAVALQGELLRGEDGWTSENTTIALANGVGRIDLELPFSSSDRPSFALEISWADTAALAELLSMDPTLVPAPLKLNVETTAGGSDLVGDLTWDHGALTGRVASDTTQLQLEAKLLVAGGVGELIASVPLDRAPLDFHVEMDWESTEELSKLLAVDPQVFVAPMNLHVDGTGQGTKLILDGSATIGDDRMSLSGFLDRDDTFNIVLDTEEFAFGPLVALWKPDLEPRMAASGHVRVFGSYQDPAATAEIDVARGQVTLGSELVVFEGLRLVIEESTRGANVTEFKVHALGGSVEAKGIVPMSATQEWNLSLALLDVRVAAVKAWLPTIRALTGRLNGSGLVTGRKAHPTFYAEGSLVEGEFAPHYWERIRELSFDYTWSVHGLGVTSIKGKLGGGSIVGEAILDVGEDSSFMEWRLGLSGVRLYRGEGLMIRASGDLKLAGTAELPRLTGDLEIVRGLYTRDVYPTLGTASTVPFELFTIEDGFASRIDFDVSLRMNGDMRVDNNRVKVSPYGSLRLLGTGHSPFLNGTLTTTEGSVELPHMTAVITHAELTFPVEDPYQPRLESTAVGEVGGHEITMLATGPLSELEVAFRSPGLTDENTVSLVTTGLLVDQVREQGVESVAAFEAFKVYGPKVWDDLFGSGTSKGVFDVVKNVKYTVEAAQDASQADRVVLELPLDSWLSVIGEQDHRGDINLDILVFKWWP